jgi:MFS family permease
LTESNTGAPRAFAALGHAGFRPYLLYSAVAMMADSIEHVISYWMIFQKFQSPALGGFAIIAHWAPLLLFGVWSGALADRYDPRRLIQLGMALFMVASVAWAVLFLTDTLQMWHAIVLLIVHGFANVFWGPASQVMVHEIVGTTHLQSAVRLNATARYLGLLMGPAVGGALMLAVGPVYGLFFNALIYLPLVLWLWKAPYGPKFRAGGPAPVRAVRGFADIRDTVRDISGNRTLVSMLLLSGGAALFIGNAYQAQIPEFAHDLGYGDAGMTYSMLLAADAAGALIAGLVLESRGLLQPNPRTAFILAMLWCVAMMCFAASTSYPLALALLFAAGFLELSFNAMSQTLVQLEAPAGIRGRVMGLFQMASAGLRTFSGVTVGVMGAVVGIHWSLALSAMVLLVLCGTLLGFARR